MHAYMNGRPAWTPLRMAAVVAAGIVLGACAPSEVLEVYDPDIINPSEVQSPAGANAVRLGALGRLNVATSGDESLFLLGGLFTDEFNNGDSFIDRQQIDQRTVVYSNSFLTSAYRAVHRARASGEQAVALLREFVPTGPAANVAEMYWVQAFTENLIAEHFCNGVVFSNSVTETLGAPMTTAEAFQRALAHADSGLALITGTSAADVKVRNALQLTRGRILVNLNRHADAATAVAGVPTGYKYEMFHALTATSNAIWNLNNNARRYSVSTGEGTNGMPFATAGDPRVPVCLGGDAACTAIGVPVNRRDDLTSPMYAQRIWPARESSVAILTGVEARLIEAEAQMKAGNSSGSLATLNALRAATGTGSGGVAGLTPLLDAGSMAAREDQLFRERAFWLFGRGTRTGDLRRLVRQYGRNPATVFPVGAWHKGGNYGPDMNFPIPQVEENNENVPAGQDKICIDRNA